MLLAGKTNFIKMILMPRLLNYFHNTPMGILLNIFFFKYFLLKGFIYFFLTYKQTKQLALYNKKGTSYKGFTDVLTTCTELFAYLN